MKWPDLFLSGFSNIREMGCDLYIAVNVLVIEFKLSENYVLIRQFNRTHMLFQFVMLKSLFYSVFFI